MKTIIYSLIFVLSLFLLPTFVIAQTTGCNLTVQAVLENTSIPNVFPGDWFSNRLVITNPNDPSCGTNTYLISRGYPAGWLLDIPNYVEASGSASVMVPFDIRIASDSAAMRYTYDFWIYNSWADGSGTATASGAVDVAARPTPIPTPTPTPVPDRTLPSVSITGPLNNSFVARNSLVTIHASASDNVAISKVEFLVNNSLICTDFNLPYSCSFVTSNKKGVKYSLMVKAYDPSNNVGMSSIVTTTK